MEAHAERSIVVRMTVAEAVELSAAITEAAPALQAMTIFGVLQDTIDGMT